jgi:hypothetical protein
MNNELVVCIQGNFKRKTNNICAEPVYEHLGCYSDQTTSPDLSGSVTVLQQPTAAACAKQCAASGFPYAGLQAASSCFCGISYGKYGQG